MSDLVSDPRDTRRFPPTVKAADGKTTLKRYRVDAIIYAPSLKAARARFAEDLYIDAGRVIQWMEEEERN